MVDLTTVGITVGVIIVLVVIWVLASTYATRWYKVYLANNEVWLMYRTFRERWDSSDRYVRFRRDDNKRLFTFASEAHWVFGWEQIPNNEVGIVRGQIIESKQKQLQENAGA